MSSDLLTAAKNGYFTRVVTLLADGSCDVNARDKDKATPLYWSASRGHENICEVLIQAGCDVNACVKWGSTALHAAADRGHAECLTVLIRSGAHVNVQNERGDTALHLAAYRGFKDLVQILVNAQADPFAKNGQSKTALQEALSQGNAPAVGVLQTYMESLGFPAFKSLPASETSKPPSKEESPTSTVPAQSWPRFQSFPKYPDNTPPAELSRPHTYPLKVDNRSNNTIGGSSELKGIGTWSENKLSEEKDYKALKGFQFPNGKSHHHIHSEPQENVDECIELNKVQVVKDIGSKHHSKFVPNDQPLYNTSPNLGVKTNEFVPPVSAVAGNYQPCAMNPSSVEILLNTVPPGEKVWRNQNGQTGSEGGKRSRYLHNDPSVPDIALPLHVNRRPENFVKHEDLTLFADSLQLEVVKLRDSLASKDKEVSEMQGVIFTLTSRNAQLERLIAEKKNDTERVLAAKQSEVSDLRKKLCDVEKQNVCLQQALVEGQASSGKLSEQHDQRVSELTTRICDLEQMNASLQRLIVTQQDNMKGMLEGKDQEIAYLRSKMDVFSPKSIPMNVVSSSQLPGDSTAVYGQPVSPTESLSCQPDADLLSHGTASSKTSKTKTGSVISDCDQALAPSSIQTDTRQHTHYYLPNTDSSSNRAECTTATMTSHVMASCQQPVHASSGNTSLCRKTPECGSSDPVQCRLRAKVSALFRDTSDLGNLDVCGREWKMGKEFQLLDTKPVNCSSDGQRRGSCSLVFSITHQRRKYMLKMLMNLINMSYEAHSLGRSLDAHLLHRFGAEFHAPLLLHSHPNIVRVRHHYQGDTSQFRSYLPLLVPPSLDVPVDMARRTTFLVLEHYPQTLLHFMNGFSVSMGSRTEELSEQFVLQLVYQLLSAVEYLQRHDVVHRDIKADNVFLDWRLRPVLGDFGFARTLRGYGGQTVPFTDPDQAFAGNPHAWAPELCRLSRMTSESSPPSMTLSDVYAKSDGFAVARMLYYLFHDNDTGMESFPISSQHQPHYPDSAVPLLQHPASPALAHFLRLLVLDDPSRRPTVRQTMCSVGVLLCKPTTELMTEREAEEFCTSQLHRLSSQSITRLSPPAEGTLSVADSVRANQDHCMADFLVNFSGKDFWEAYKELKNLGHLQGSILSDDENPRH